MSTVVMDSGAPTAKAQTITGAGTPGSAVDVDEVPETTQMNFLGELRSQLKNALLFVGDKPEFDALRESMETDYLNHTEWAVLMWSRHHATSDLSELRKIVQDTYDELNNMKSRLVDFQENNRIARGLTENNITFEEDTPMLIGQYKLLRKIDEDLDELIKAIGAFELSRDEN